MEEINIKLSTGTKFTRDKVGTCIITIKNKEKDFEITLDEEETVEVLVSDILKQQAIIEENKRQQDVTVHQFRQAQEELQQLNKEKDRFRKALHQFANMKTVRTAPELVIQMYSRYAQELLEGRGTEGDAE
ncbi:hypothetical protein O0R52_16020 [Bacillus halotolerans]|uniref:Uncharacterized protein n=1 Tax=Bacillus halotolerans TaxID=260554 RepID=A0ABY7HXQ7_9BACI|nr:hypothetical protein [Bacillus halotolerans]MDG0765218.1 hypothetical protein [Bacillus halotolerans]WAT20456.1 hypothetical protein O0R52_16020 [Bacillus halotolerans]